MTHDPLESELQSPALSAVWCSPPRHVFEYSTIHNNRMNLVRIIHLWHQISLTGSLALFATLTSAGINGRSIIITIMAAVFSSIILIISRYVQRQYDHAIVDLYPRIVALEIILDFSFYRNYLRLLGRQNPVYVKFIDDCEKNTVSRMSVSDVCSAVEKLHQTLISDPKTRREFYSRKGRAVVFHKIPWLMIPLYLLVTILVVAMQLGIVAEWWAITPCEQGATSG